MNVIVFASFVPKPGKEDMVRGIVERLVEPTRAEPGNLVYNFYRSTTEPVTFHVFEIYADHGGLEAHRASDHYKAYRAKIPAFLAEPIAVKVLNGIDVA